MKTKGKNGKVQRRKKVVIPTLAASPTYRWSSRWVMAHTAPAAHATHTSVVPKSSKLSGRKKRRFDAKMRRPRKVRGGRRGMLCGEVILWHGTRRENVDSIREHGLRPGSVGCMFGAAIYVGPLTKAEFYGDGTLIKVAVTLGRIFRADAATYAQPQGYDSVHGLPDRTIGIRRAEEYAIYDPRDVRVLEILTS